MATEDEDPWRQGEQYGIKPSYQTSAVQDHFDAVMDRYIDPAIDSIERELRALQGDDPGKSDEARIPIEIVDSLSRFLADHPQTSRNAFIMMRFGETQLHDSILRAIQSNLTAHGIEGFRADHREYHEDLFPNVLTYLHGCSFGIAVFERLLQDEFNPNVSLEFGYMRALNKPVCLLKDETLKTLQSDLAGKLYRPFDPQDPEGSIPAQLTKWMSDKNIV